MVAKRSTGFVIEGCIYVRGTTIACILHFPTFVYFVFNSHIKTHFDNFDANYSHIRVTNYLDFHILRISRTWFGKNWDIFRQHLCTQSLKSSTSCIIPRSEMIILIQHKDNDKLYVVQISWFTVNLNMRLNTDTTPSMRKENLNP